MNDLDILDALNRLLLQTRVSESTFMTYVIYNHKTKYVHFRERGKPDIISPITIDRGSLQKWFDFLCEEVFDVARQEVYNVDNRGTYSICGPRRILEKIVKICELEKRIEELSNLINT